MYDYMRQYNGMQPVPQQFDYSGQGYRQPQVNTNKIYVSGIDDVRLKTLPPNSDYIFLDNDKAMLYQKIVSSNGQFEVKAFNITPYNYEEATKAQNSIDLSGYAKTSDLEAIKSEINEINRKLNETNNI